MASFRIRFLVLVSVLAQALAFVPLLHTQFGRSTVSSSANVFAAPLRTARLSKLCALRMASMGDLSKSQLAQLASMTTLSVDTGDLNLVVLTSGLQVIEELAATGYITDAGLSGDPRYVAFVDEAVAYAKKKNTGSEDEKVALAMDRLAVNLGRDISKLVKGYVSTEVDPRLSFDMEQSLQRARRIIAMYEEEGVPRSRILIKLAATWEGILTAEVLEKEGITCNLTLVFGILQAAAAAQRGARLISPFTGRILDWHKADKKKDIWEPKEDPGVVECTRMYNYYKKYGHETICMPASWRPSRGAGYDLDEIRALAGSDRMTIPPNFLQMLVESNEPLERMLEPKSAAAACTDPPFGGGRIEEKEFRFLLNQDGCTTEKMAQGIRAFVADTDKLEAAIRAKFK